MERDVCNILIVGVGGQGTLLTSRIIAQAALAGGMDVKVSEVHGMAQRGGSVVSQVRYGRKIHSPIIKKGDADIILAFEKIEAARWLDYLKPGGTVIVNEDRIDPLPVMSGKAKYPVDITDRIKRAVEKSVLVDATAIAEKMGNSKAANIVLVGVLNQFTAFPHAVIREAIKAMVPPALVELNLQAYEKGIDLSLEKTGV